MIGSINLLGISIFFDTKKASISVASDGNGWLLTVESSIGSVVGSTKLLVKAKGESSLVYNAG